MAKKWIAKAVKRPGAFTAWCKKQGFKGVTAECIAKGRASKNTRVKRMAVLAQTFRKYGGRKKGK